eukprot:351025-Chlamydomonas_euryale.AAC.2
MLCDSCACLLPRVERRRHTPCAARNGRSLVTSDAPLGLLDDAPFGLPDNDVSPELPDDAPAGLPGVRDVGDRQVQLPAVQHALVVQNELYNLLARRAELVADSLDAARQHLGLPLGVEQQRRLDDRHAARLVEHKHAVVVTGTFRGAAMITGVVRGAAMVTGTFRGAAIVTGRFRGAAIVRDAFRGVVGR